MLKRGGIMNKEYCYVIVEQNIDKTKGYEPVHIFGGDTHNEILNYIAKYTIYDFRNPNTWRDFIDDIYELEEHLKEEYNKDINDYVQTIIIKEGTK